MNISYKRMIDILGNGHPITEKECLSLSAIFNTDFCFWWNQHNNYNNWVCSNQINLSDYKHAQNILFIVI